MGEPSSALLQMQRSDITPDLGDKDSQAMAPATLGIGNIEFVLQNSEKKGNEPLTCGANGVKTPGKL